MNKFIEFLIGHELVEFSNGIFSFSRSVPFIISGIILIIVAVWLLYLKTTTPLSRLSKFALIALKSLALVILFMALLRPILTLSKTLPQQSYLGILIDDSESMSIPDMDGRQSRGAVLQDVLYQDNGVIARLRENFRVQTFRFDQETYRMWNADSLTRQGTGTSISQGLEHTIDRLKGFPLSGIVLISDGGNNDEHNPVHTASRLQSLNIPVFSVGVGQAVIAKDVEIVQVRSTKTVIENSIFEVHVLVRHQGYEGHDVNLEITEGGAVVVTQKITLGKNGTTQQHTVELIPTRQGLLTYTLRLVEQAGEIIAANNQQTFLVNNQPKPADILYIEGHPRHEYKFIQRALKGDEFLRLATYLQTAPQKFLRQGITSPQELSTGFPTSKEDLYHYEAIIFGDVAKKFFTDQQLSLTQSFITERGGGFLMIGGSTAFEEGFIDTPIADLLPVTLIREPQLPAHLRRGERQGMSAVGDKFILQLTPEGEQSSILRLGFQGEMNQQQWQKMPSLQSINVTGSVKPGATILAVHPTLRYQNAPLPLMVHERYGRGRTMALTTASTWRWQMLLPFDDTSHERFWRQLTRWLTGSAPAPLELSLDRDIYQIGDTVAARARVVNRAYAPVKDATVWLKISHPNGAIQDMPLKWDIQEEGMYTGSFIAQEQGVYHLEALSTTPAHETHEASMGVLVSASMKEYTNASMDATLLRNIAEVSGGKFYTIDEMDQLINDVEHLSNEYAVQMEEELWDMPLVMLLLLSCFSLEWFIRRQKGIS